MKKYVLCLSFWCTTVLAANGQSNWYCYEVPAKDTIALNDTLTIITESIQFTTPSNDTIPTSSFFILNKQIIFPKKNPFNGKYPFIKICYRTLPFNLEKRVVHLDTIRIRPELKGDLWQYRPFDNNKSNSVLPSTKDLSYSGGLTRGISVGNNQDLVVNSNFSLQMAGKLSKDIEISAAMSDNTIPIQPDGNTAQLNQFDRIFIQLKRKNALLNAGDFDLARPNSYFVTYNKRVQGLGAQYVEKFNNKATLRSGATGAVSRGKFNRQLILGTEGNQGPYRLNGNGGEQFIIVVSATERIFIDGLLLKRGYENDYTIDYNQGTLSFTSKRLITKDTRITAEFDYTDQSFVRTLYTVSSEYESERVKLHFNLYGEQDGRTSGTQQSLSENDKKALAEGGDALNIFSEGVDTVEFSKDRLLYKSLTDSSGKTYFEISSHPDSARYFVRFMEVANGEGDYSVKISSANGRIFQYEGPGKGNYRIGTKLTTPKLFQVYAIGAEINLLKNKNATFKSELVMSKNDQNRLSNLNKADDLGFATMLQYQHKIKLSKFWRLHLDGSYEGTQQQFKVLNPYRSIEFSRDWNTANNATATNEQIFRGMIDLRRDSLGNIQYEFNRFDRKDQYLGNKQILNYQFEKKGWLIAGANSLLRSESQFEQTTFFRPRADLKKLFHNKQHSVGLYFEKESNTRKVADTLDRSSFDFEILKAYSNFDNKKGFSLVAFAQQRIDRLPLKGQFAKSSTAHELNLTGSYSNKKGILLNGNFAYRTLQINNRALINLQPQESYLGRLNFSWSKFKNAILLNTTYELGSGQEQRLEYYYQKVQPGFGALTWRDYNKDGNIQQDEVFTAIFRDSANIVRFVLPTNQFVRTQNMGFNQVVNLSPGTVWLQEKGIKKILSHLSSESYWQIQNRLKLGAVQPAWNPFIQISINDSSLVAATNSQRHTLYFNRSHPSYEISAGKNDNVTRSLLTSGYDIRGFSENFIRTRWNINRKVSLRLTFTQSTKKSESEFLILRNYLIHSKTIEPESNIMLRKDFRMHIIYSFSQSLDTLNSRSSAKIHNLSNEITYNYSSKTAIRAKLSLVQIDYTGTPNAPVQYIMLNGLQSGENFLWSFQLNQALNKTLQLELRYDGRKTGSSGRIIHTGNMAIRAIF
ncbi:MAG: hypothetical protein ACOYOA_00250 [Saprospiraceae bacterium]